MWKECEKHTSTQRVSGCFLPKPDERQPQFDSSSCGPCGPCVVCMAILHTRLILTCTDWLVFCQICHSLCRCFGTNQIKSGSAMFSLRHVPVPGLCPFLGCWIHSAQHLAGDEGWQRLARDRSDRNCRVELDQLDQLKQVTQ